MNEPEVEPVAATSNAPSPAMSRGRMTEGDFDQVLAELATVAEELIAAAQTVEAEMDAADQLLEQHVSVDAVGARRPGPTHAMLSAQWHLLTQTARAQRATARDFAAWWADLATLAFVSAAMGVSVPPARAAAADPTTIWLDEDLDQLPTIPEDVLGLAKLAGSIAGARPGGRLDHELVESTTEFAARNGIRITGGADGEITVEKDGDAQGRRCQLWGPTWAEHRAPVLPSADELVDPLTRHHAPPEIVTAVRAATQAVHDAVSAAERLREHEKLETDEQILTPDEDDALWQQAQTLTPRLAQYAKTLTEALTHVRQGGHESD